MSGRLGLSAAKRLYRLPEAQPIDELDKRNCVAASAAALTAVKNLVLEVYREPVIAATYGAWSPKGAFLAAKFDAASKKLVFDSDGAGLVEHVGGDHGAPSTPLAVCRAWRSVALLAGCPINSRAQSET